VTESRTAGETKMGPSSRALTYQGSDLSDN